MNQKTNSILVLILLVSNIILFVLYFNLKSSTSGSPQGQNSNSTLVLDSNKVNGTGHTKVVYFKLDTLYKNYTYYTELMKVLENDYERKMVVLQKQRDGLKNKFEEYQRKAYRMSPEQMKEAEMDLAGQEQELMKQIENADGDFQNKRAELNDKLVNKIRAYLTLMKAENSFDMIFAEFPGSAMIMGSDAHDITNELTSGLNKERELELKQNKK